MDVESLDEALGLGLQALMFSAKICGMLAYKPLHANDLKPPGAFLAGCGTALCLIGNW